ncbi:pyruvate kinase [Streptomyces tauricus]|uniref:Pyruvate kinase n=1 Tax=Streptomyces tauricus TaxID=68274 RepID=A0ABZ1JTF8_9ACTN|nr:pyruvate kinase [Streptomyces tauricus]
MHGRLNASGANPAHASRRTAIIATIGANSVNRDSIDGMIAAGADMFRLSMVSGGRERHTTAVGLVRELAAERGRAVRLLADLQGRKNRIGGLPRTKALWYDGEEVLLTHGEVDAGRGDHHVRSRLPWHADLVRPGTSVLIDDGLIELSVVESQPGKLRCTVVHGGPVSNGRGLTIQGATGIGTGLNDRDVDDLAFARSLGVDAVALSFAASAHDAHDLRAVAGDAILMGKVEHPGALAVLDELAASFDVLMVARGDLALEIPFEDVPFAQDEIVTACAKAERASVVATQFLHSMREHIRPTRAEVSDIAHAVLRGADALMLSGETGFGKHPVRAVEVMRRVVERAEREMDMGNEEPWPR